METVLVIGIIIAVGIVFLFVESGVDRLLDAITRLLGKIGLTAWNTATGKKEGGQALAEFTGSVFMFSTDYPYEELAQELVHQLPSASTPGENEGFWFVLKDDTKLQWAYGTSKRPYFVASIVTGCTVEAADGETFTAAILTFDEEGRGRCGLSEVQAMREFAHHVEDTVKSLDPSARRRMGDF